MDNEPKIPGGYILVSRKLIESEIFDKPPMYVKVWLFLLSQAQYDNYKNLKRGQLFTSISEIQEACSWYVGYRKETPSKSEIYRIIDWLRKRGEREATGTTNEKMIETTKATHGMVVEVLNYGLYQDPKNYERNADRNDEKTTKVERTKQNRNNINKNVKNVKNDKKEIKTSCSNSDEPNGEVKFGEETRPYKAALYLRNKIEEGPVKQPLPEPTPEELEKWSAEMDRLNRLGPVGANKSDDFGYSWEEISKLIDWCQQDNFWQQNILSAPKFRKQIQKLESRMKENGEVEIEEYNNEMKMTPYQQEQLDAIQ
ncbi:hypothetical protein [Halarsenatibacter silvermanii]|uniref:Lin1244/Lin1753-like N-terminal domain-containing protein n=1 Tax=Halarsenatibacter silvermanii TaxID=321763 RepID=A0A1G9R960_9FIRM|nr:hypothetical protein [Halarsenatibacter silvermanii]SDM19660.1 hypothetical protein SAMN04488692_1213 [Halarsenatibacter silvermanii]